MSLVKTTLAVVTAAAVLLIAAPLASAETTLTPDEQTQLSTNTAQSRTVHGQVHRLATSPYKTRTYNYLQARLVRADTDLLAVNRRLATYTRAVLAAPEASDELLDGLLATMATTAHVNSDATRLNSRALRTRSAWLGRAVRSAQTRLAALRANVRDAKASRNQPTFTPVDPSVTPEGWDVVEGKTFTTYVVPSSTAYVVYENCTFTGGRPDWNGVLTLTNPAHDLIFRNCTIMGGPVNGVTMVDYGASLYNITFANCTFQSSKRMGFECINRGGSTSGYYNVNLIGCTFEPQGSEAISFDGYASDITITGNLVKGAGTNPEYPWGQGIEINGPRRVTMTYNTVYQTRREMLNLQYGGSTDCGWVITNNVFDGTEHRQSLPMQSGVNSVSGIDIVGGVFADNIIRQESPAGGVAGFTGCKNMDWRTTTWYDPRGGAYERPWQDATCAVNVF